MFTSLLITVGIGGVIGLLTAVALMIAAWLIDVAVSAIAALLRKIKERIAVVRKRKAMKKLLITIAQELEKAAEESEEKEQILEAVNDLNDMCDNNGAAFAVPLDAQGVEHWEKVNVIEAEEPSRDNMSDVTVVTMEGRYRSIVS